MIDLRLGDALTLARELETGSVQTIITSPAFWGLRDYGMPGQWGLEKTPEEYVCHLVELFRELRRGLRDDGTLWLNLGDSYGATTNRNWIGTGVSKPKTQANNGSFNIQTGLKPKDLVGIPWRVAFALQADGWYLRSDIIWHKPNPMPESVTDRPTKSHEYIFLLSKQARYYYDADAIREKQDPLSLERLKRGWNGNGERGYPNGPQNHLKDYMGKTDEEIAELKGRNKRSVWTVSTHSFADAHFATFPPKLIVPCILAGCPPDGVVLDPFVGSGTTALVAHQLGRNALGFELNPDYYQMAKRRCDEAQLQLKMELE